MFDNQITKSCEIIEVFDGFQKHTPFDELSCKGMANCPDLEGCVFKKCCKKYKRGKRCKKCPNS